MQTEWMTQKCAGPRVRWTDQGQIEIEGEGTPEKQIPDRVYQYKDLIFAASAKYGVPASFIAGIITLESGGRADVVSADGGYGLMQITDATLKGGRSREELLDPATNIDIGVGFLAKLLAKYGGNPISSGHAYNSGGAYCNGGLSGKADEKGQRCSPNRWNLVAYCPSLAAGTLDYGTIALKYTNYAATHGFGPGDAPALPPPPSPDDGQPVVARAGIPPFAAFLIAVGGMISGYFGCELASNR